MTTIRKAAAGLSAVTLATAFVALYALAAPGDFQYVIRGAETTLNATSKTRIGNHVNNTYSGVASADLDGENCWKDLDGDKAGEWQCYASAEDTLTDTELGRAELDDVVFKSVTANGDNWDTVRVYNAPYPLPPSGLYWLDQFTESHCSLDHELVYSYDVQRDPDVPTTVHGRCYPFKTATPSVYADDRAAGIVVKIISEVE